MLLVTPILVVLFVKAAFAAKRECYLGLDVGTQGTKCVAYSPGDQRVIARSSFGYGLAPNPDGIPGRAEQDPQIWLDAVDVCLKKIANQIRGKYSIEGIGVSGQQHGLVALNEDCNPVRLAKLWCDVEACEQAERLKKMSAHIRSLDFLTAGFTSPKILWMKENEPELYERTRWIVMPHDFVTMKLAGLESPVTDPGDASGNGVFDSKSRQHDAALAAIVDRNLIEKLPVVLPSDSVAGYLSERYLKMLNLPLSSRIPVSVGSGDNMCSALGVGCVKPGQIVMSLGASGTLFGVTNTPVPTNTPVAPFCDATGRHLPLACTMSCTAVLQHVLKHWCKDMTHEAASARAAAVPIGSLGVTFLPYLGGERTPNLPNAFGVILGLTMQNFQDPFVLYRACLEGISFVLADALQHFGAVNQMYIVGGGSKNRIWCQMIADMNRCEITFPSEPESAALGAAFLAGAAACGMKIHDFVSQQDIAVSSRPISPIPEHYDAYQEAFTRFKTSTATIFQESSWIQHLVDYGLQKCLDARVYAHSLSKWFASHDLLASTVLKTKVALEACYGSLSSYVNRSSIGSEYVTEGETDEAISELIKDAATDEDITQIPPRSE